MEWGLSCELDVIVEISSTSQPTELLVSVAIASQYVAVAISLTKTNSDLAKLADISIQIDIPEDQDIYKPSASCLVYIAVIDVLVAGAARKRSEHIKQKLTTDLNIACNFIQGFWTGANWRLRYLAVIT